MAFTSAESAKIRTYLGYPSVFKQANPRLESAISVVGGDADMVTMVQALLVDIAAAWTALQTTALDSAGMKSLDKGDVELYDDNKQTKGIQNIGRMGCNRLSGIFGVPICTDVFGTGGYAGDGWAAANGMSSLAGLG